MAKIKVMIVEDSKVVQTLLTEILESDEHISVSSVVSSAEEALVEMEKNKPDLITIDIQLPKMDGLGLTNQIMKKNPIPIIVISGVSEKSSVVNSFDLIQAGALAAISKPVGIDHKDYKKLSAQLISTVKLMSEIKLVTRRDLKELKRSKFKASATSHSPAKQRVIAIGASTGGPTAIQTILKALPKDFPVPIVIAQHIAEGFVDGFTSWLSSTTAYQVKVARHNDKLEGAKAYICPDGYQTSISSARHFLIENTEYINGVRPSVSYLFDSVANNYGENAIAVLLSGMGKDGARELNMIKEKGGVTIAQDRKSSIVHGMPGEAINLGAAEHILNAESIPKLLIELASTNVNSTKVD